MSDPESTSRVPAACPSCSPDADTAHEVLKPGDQATVRCTRCGHVHKITVDTPSTIERDVIVSQDGESLAATAEIPPTELLAVGDEFVVDTPEAIMLVRITSLEVGDERRAEAARAEAVRTVWTRAVDNVSVNVTVHPSDGRRDDTRSLTVHVPGDYEFTVGAVESFGSETVEIEGIHIREEAPKYRHSKLDHDGDVAFAKDVKRVYARDDTTTAWSAW